jgi:hypothetical protein
MNTPAPLHELLQRVRDEYDNTPRLRLTPSQAQQRFELEPRVCITVLEALLTERFLVRTQDGLFQRSAPH